MTYFHSDVARVRFAKTVFTVGKADNGHITGPYNNYTVANRGNTIWFTAKIDQLENYDNVRLQAAFDYEPSEENPEEHRQNSKIGIWTSVKDQPSILHKSSQSDSYAHGDNEQVILELDKWKFGKCSQIMFDVSQAEQDSTIQLVFGAMPFFHARDGNNAECELKISLFVTEKDTYDEVEIETIEDITFKLKATLQSDSSTEIKLMEKLGAYHIDGQGNSVHPKQLYTDIVLSEQLNQNPSNGVEIAYIGTDTFENLLSMIRRFKSVENYRAKVKKLFIYYTESWDKTIMKKYPNLKIDEDISGGAFEVEFKEIPKDGTPIDDVIPVDYVLATYVTPWAMAEHEKNRDQYSILIQNLLNKNDAKLISIDPADSSKVIRSHSDAFNLDDLYKNELNLRPVDSEEYNEHSIIDWTVWKLKEVA